MNSPSNPRRSADSQPSELPYEEYIAFLQEMHKTVGLSPGPEKVKAFQAMATWLDESRLILFHQTLCTSDFYGKDSSITSCIDALIPKLRDGTIEKLFESTQVSNEYRATVIRKRYLQQGVLPNKLGRIWCKDALNNHISVLSSSIYSIAQKTQLFSQSFFTRNRRNPFLHSILVCLIREVFQSQS